MSHQSRSHLIPKLALFFVLATLSLPIFCAIDSIRRVAEDIGDPSAQFLLGHMYANGQEVAVDMVKAQKWYSKAAKQGHIEAQFRLAKLFFDKNQFKKALPWFRESALKGWPDSNYHLGLMYLKGSGVPQDYGNARKHLEKASRRSHGAAMYELGLIHYHGYGTPKSNKKARSWFFKASKNGSIKAQYELGRFLFAGIGGPKRAQQAKVWLEKAALGGIKDAEPLLRRLGSKVKSVSQVPTIKPNKIPVAQKSKPIAKSTPAIKKETAVAKRAAKPVSALHGRAKKGNIQAQLELARDYEKKQDMNKALHWYEQAALRGSLEAKLYLAEIHNFGKGVKKDLRVSLIWWRAAAEKHKNPEAYFQLGQAYKFGYGVRKNQSRSLEWYKKAAKSGHAMAQLELGQMYLEGKGVDKNIPEARKWLKQAAKQNVAQAHQLLSKTQSSPVLSKTQSTPITVNSKQNNSAPTVLSAKTKPIDTPKFKPMAKGNSAKVVPLQPWEMGKEQQVSTTSKPLGNSKKPIEISKSTPNLINKNTRQNETEYIRRKDLLQVPLQTLMSEAKLGRSKAQMALGLLYKSGSNELKQDIRQSAYWLLQAAKRGNGEAQYQLGLLYEENKQYSTSMKWYRMAASSDYIKANIAVGNLYRRGRGVSRDYLKAAKWYKKASKRLDPEAQYLLAQMYQRGLGVNRDRVQALKWYKLSAKNAFLPAQYELGNILFRMGSRNLQESKRWQGIDWLSKAAEGNYLDAQLRLAKIYEEGNKVNKNFRKAAHWYAKAAAQGNAASQTKIAHYYRQGRGVKRNIDKAIEWYTLAGQQGDSEALFNLGEIYYIGDSVEVNLQTASKWYELAKEQGNRKAITRLNTIKRQLRPKNMVGSSFPN